jgi:hypothetical protein
MLKPGQEKQLNCKDHFLHQRGQAGNRLLQRGLIRCKKPSGILLKALLGVLTRIPLFFIRVPAGVHLQPGLFQDSFQVVDLAQVVRKMGQQVHQEKAGRHFIPQYLFGVDRI